MSLSDFEDANYFTWEYEGVIYFGYWNAENQYFATASPKYKKFQRGQVSNIKAVKIVDAASICLDPKVANEIEDLLTRCFIDRDKPEARQGRISQASETGERIQAARIALKQEELELLAEADFDTSINPALKERLDYYKDAIPVNLSEL